MFKHAYVRTSSEIYNLDESNLDQVYVHLTNNAVQKYSKNYGQYEEANICGVDVILEELVQSHEGVSQEELMKNLEKSMQEIIEDSL